MFSPKRARAFSGRSGGTAAPPMGKPRTSRSSSSTPGYSMIWRAMAGTPPNAVSPPSEALFIGELIRADESAVIVAEASREIVGNALVMTDRDVSSRHVGVLSVTVANGWRDVGLGTALVAATQDWVRDRGLTRLALSVFPDNARAIAVYTRAGFVREGIRRRQFRQADGTYRDELLMAWFPEGGAADRWRAGEGTP